MNTLLKKYILAGALIPSLALSSFVLPASAAEPVCETITMVSDSSTQTAGWSETNQDGAPGSLSPSNYSGSGWSSALATETFIPPWIDPATHPDYTGSGATWISSALNGPGAEGNTEGSASSSQWRLFRDTFTLPAGATVNSAQIWYAVDDAAAVHLNNDNTSFSTTNTGPEEVYGASPVAPIENYDHSTTATFTPVAGVNNLDFVVRNWSGDLTANPTGLLYKAVINYCVPSSVKVTINKYVGGEMATASSSQNYAFPMVASWDSENLGAPGTGEYTLSPIGANSPNPYQAVTADMTPGADYSTYEKTDGEFVAADCSTNKPYRLLGYTTGSTAEEAAGGTPSMTIPSFTNLMGDKHVIVWNAACSSTSTTTGEIGGEVTGNNGVLMVTSINATQTNATADDTYEHGWKYTFNITVPTNEPKLALKFADWFNSTASSTLPVANNMRISSAQASSTATITLTAANTYSSPDMMITGDLDPAMAGRQVQVLVEVKIPNSTVNGSYTTSYGVRSLPN